MSKEILRQPNQREITGLKPDSSATQNADIPTVLRDTRGRVRWSLPGNTPEENEQLGIRNIQGLFLEKFPDFDDLFPREEDGKIAEDRREEAKKFILEGVQTGTDFRKMVSSWRKMVSYFGSSYTVMMQKAFIPWDIDLESVMSERRTNTNLRRWPNFRIEERIRVIRDKALEIFNNEGRLSHDFLKKHKKGLLKQILKYYPGGVVQLKIDLQVPLNRVAGKVPKPPHYWTQTKIEEEATEFIKTEGGLTKSLLHSKGRYDLTHAISGRYPGGMLALKERLGITSQKAEPTVSPDQANEELKRFLEVKNE